MAVTGRLLRTARLLERSIEEELAAHGLEVGWFDVLSALRRRGRPYTLTPGELARAVMLSTGGMTKRLDRMEEQGLLRRRPHPQDRRGSLIEMTAAGRRRIESAVGAHARNEARMLSPLTRAEQSELERLLDRISGPLR